MVHVHGAGANDAGVGPHVAQNMGRKKRGTSRLLEVQLYMILAFLLLPDLPDSARMCVGQQLVLSLKYRSI